MATTTGKARGMGIAAADLSEAIRDGYHFPDVPLPSACARTERCHVACAEKRRS